MAAPNPPQNENSADDRSAEGNLIIHDGDQDTESDWNEVWDEKNPFYGMPDSPGQNSSMVAARAESDGKSLKAKVFVGRVPSALGADRLREMFEKYGAVTECQAVKDCAFVHMDSESAAENAIKAYHNLSIEGGTFIVEKSHGMPARSKMQETDGGSGRGGSSKGRRDDGYDLRDSGNRGGFVVSTGSGSIAHEAVFGTTWAYDDAAPFSAPSTM